MDDWIAGRGEKRSHDAIRFAMNPRKNALTQHGVRNDDADRRPQESQSLLQGSFPGSVATLVHPSQATGAFDNCDNSKNIAEGFFVDVIPQG